LDFVRRIANYFDPPTDDPAFQRISSARRQALLEQNEFVLKLIDRRIEQQNTFEKQLDLIFAMTIFFACNLWIFGDQNVQTISQVLASVLDKPMDFGALRAVQCIYFIFFFLTFGLSLYGIRPIMFTNEEIYLPKPEKKEPEVPPSPEGSYVRRLPPAIAPSKSQWGGNGNSGDDPAVDRAARRE
jgi:hypothetical protein